MSEKTFIEIWYEDDDSHSNWFAISHRTKWKDGSPEMLVGWTIENGNVTVYDRHDIAALRTLLDEIEKEFGNE